MLHMKFIWVGKLKKPHWRTAAEHYSKRLGQWFRFREIIVKDGTGQNNADKIIREGQAILEKITPQDLVVCMDEHGRTMTSTRLSVQLQTWLEHPGKAPCFVIGGAYGLSTHVLERADISLSLSPMTFPHELARVILLEQIYRAGTILKGVPYHHE